MQCHNGDGTCHSDITGQIQNPCPDGVVSSLKIKYQESKTNLCLQITQMVREGSAGTRDGDGLAQTINRK